MAWNVHTARVSHARCEGLSFCYLTGFLASKSVTAVRLMRGPATVAVLAGTILSVGGLSPLLFFYPVKRGGADIKGQRYERGNGRQEGHD